jgi:heat shock protein HslJ
MNPEIYKRPLTLKAFLPVLLVLGVALNGNVFATEMYRVSAQIFRLGELIGSPVMLVEEGETTGGTYSAPGEAQYRFVVLIRPVADDQVSASLEFTSGKITIQPNLLVDINKETSVTIDETRMVLLVERESASMNANISLTGTSWWVEDIAGKGVIDMSHTTIEFPEEGKVAGDAGCNRYFGGVEIAGSNMKVGALASTRKMCPPALMDQETNFFQAMGKVASWEIAETGLLHLQDADGFDQLRASKIEDR